MRGAQRLGPGHPHTHPTPRWAGAGPCQLFVTVINNFCKVGVYSWRAVCRVHKSKSKLGLLFICIWWMDARWNECFCINRSVQLIRLILNHFLLFFIIRILIITWTKVSDFIGVIVFYNKDTLSSILLFLMLKIVNYVCGCFKKSWQFVTVVCVCVCPPQLEHDQRSKARHVGLALKLNTFLLGFGLDLPFLSCFLLGGVFSGVIILENLNTWTVA